MTDPFSIAAFYRFTDLADPESVRGEVEARAEFEELRGSILVAREGINGTVAGPPAGLERFVEWLVDRFGLSPGAVKWAHASEDPFRKMTVRLKPEIVSLGVDGVDPNEQVGHYVDPEAWDELIERDDVFVIDCRNSYEIEVGTFRGAVDPGTERFRDFAKWAEGLEPAQTGKVAMFCTGGIRCEKASSLMLGLGFDEVYHLRGGILSYLEARGEASQTWEGECFVFDRRVSVDRQLQPGRYDLCWACRMPLSPDDKERDDYEAGVSCHRCRDTFTDAERAAKRERHRQLVADE